MTVKFYVWALLGVLVAAPFLMRFLAERVAPVRFEAAELGERLARDEYLSPTQQATVLGMLNQLTSAWPMVFLALVTPFVGLWSVFQALVARERPRVNLTGHLDTEVDYNRFFQLFFRSTGAANPIFYVIFRVELEVVRLIVRIVHLPNAVTAALLQRLVRWEMRARQNNGGMALSQ